MFASGWSVTLLLFNLFSSVNSSPVPIYTPAPPLPLQISPPPSPTFPPSLHSPFLSSPLPSPSLISSSREPEHGDLCPLTMSPSTLVVRFEDPVTANCSAPTTGFSVLGWEVSLAKPEPTMDRFLVWSVDRMTEWSIKPACYALADQGGQCHLNLSLIVYKPPHSVSISLVNDTGPMVEGLPYTLQCTVHDVAPVENLTVTFYKGQSLLGQLRSRYNTKTPVTESFSLDISPTKEDDRLSYWCKAKLDLGPEGPRHPPVVTSQKLTAVILFGPDLSCPNKVQVREGQKLACDVRGNPLPSVTWLRDGKVVVLPAHPSRKHAGKYIVWTQGLTQKNFTVEVEVLPSSGTTNSCNKLFMLAVLLLQIVVWL